MAAATKELMWLSEREEEEVGFDWSEHNANMAAKKESYSVRQPCTPCHPCRRQVQLWASQDNQGAWVALDGTLADPGVALTPSLRPAASMLGPDA